MVKRMTNARLAAIVKSCRDGRAACRDSSRDQDDIGEFAYNSWVYVEDLVDEVRRQRREIRKLATARRD